MDIFWTRWGGGRSGQTSNVNLFYVHTCFEHENPRLKLPISSIIFSLRLSKILSLDTTFCFNRGQSRKKKPVTYIVCNQNRDRSIIEATMKCFIAKVRPSYLNSLRDNLTGTLHYKRQLYDNIFLLNIIVKLVIGSP